MVRATAKKLVHLKATLEGVQASLVRELNHLRDARRVGHKVYLLKDVQGVWRKRAAFERAAAFVPARKTAVLKVKPGSRAAKVIERRRERLAAVRAS